MKLTEFVNMDEHREAIDFAYDTSSNLIFVGPRGHGKSEFIRAFLETKGHTYGDGKTFVKTLHGGIDEAELYGGLNIAALNNRQNPRLEYNLENSWLNFPVVVFEEIFDAPLSVLASLKDTITSGFFRNGNQFTPVKTRVIFAATNREIEEVAAMGETYSALLDRFPYIKRVVWERYEMNDYMKMLKASSNGFITDNSKIVARLAARATEQGHFVSPRTCWIANKHVAEKKTLKPLRHIQGFAEVFGEVAAMEEEAAIEKTFEARIEHMNTKTANMPEDNIAQVAAKLNAYNVFIATASEAQVTNKLAPRRDVLVNNAATQITRLREKIVALALEKK